MPARAEDLIRAGTAALAFDTNAMSAHNRLIALCNVANQLRQGPSPLDLRLYAPAIAHAEMVLHIRHERDKKGLTYDPAIVRQGLEDKGLQVVTFDTRHAEEVAELLAREFITPDGEPPSASSLPALPHPSCGSRETPPAALGIGFCSFSR